MRSRCGRAASTVSVRLGLHTGEPVVGEEGYTGIDVVRAARIAADGKGGQILLSEATRAIVGGNLPEGVAIREIGARTLKDIDRPEPLFEIVYAPEPQPPQAHPVPPTAPESTLAITPDAESISFDVDAEGLLRQWKQIAQSAIVDARSKTASAQGQKAAAGADFDPGKMIEERVMAELERTLGKVPGLADELRPKTPKPPKSAKPTRAQGTHVTDEIARLNELREEGALSDEQYARAVDKLLAED